MLNKNPRPTLTGESAVLILILLIALFSRFRYLGQIEHNIDHAYPVWQALSTLDAGQFPLKGQGTSVLFANPPLTGYLFIPALLITRSLVGVYVFVITLNWLGVWFSYRAIRAMLGTSAGLIAAALMAVNPWVIEYSRTSWVQSLLPCFVTGVAWLLWPVLLKQSHHPSRRVLAALVMMTLLAQTYLLAYFVVLPVMLLLLIFRRRIPWQAAALGIGLLALASVLYGAALLTDMADLRFRLDNFTSGQRQMTLEAWDSAVRLVSGAEYELARSTDAPTNDMLLRHHWSQVAHVIILTAIMTGLARAGYALIRRDRHRDAALILLLWFGLPILAMSYTSKPVHPFYMLLSFPAGYGLAAWGFATFLHFSDPAQLGWGREKAPLQQLAVGSNPEFAKNTLRSTRVGFIILTLAFIPFAGLMLLNSARYYQETAAIPGAHGLGALPVDYGLRLGQSIRQHRQPNQPVYAPELPWIINSFAGDVFEVIPDVRLPGLLRIPAQGALYITFEDSPTAPLPAPGALVDRISLPDDSLISVYSVPPTADYPADNDIPLNIPTQQGLTLVSYGLETHDAAFTLQTVWRVDDITPEAAAHIYAPFIHPFDSAGERVAIIDGEGLRGDQWRLGELHIHRMTFSLPERNHPYTLFIGQFDGLNNANLIFLPEDGDPTVAIQLPLSINP